MEFFHYLQLLCLTFGQEPVSNFIVEDRTARRDILVEKSKELVKTIFAVSCQRHIILHY